MTFLAPSATMFGLWLMIDLLFVVVAMIGWECVNIVVAVTESTHCDCSKVSERNFVEAIDR